jgi:integrase/recombinase XerC
MLDLMTLARHDVTALARARNLLRMSEEERKRFAARAVAERDHEALWSILEARLEAKRAPRTTMVSYRKGVFTLLEAWRGVDLLRPRREDADLYVLDLMAPDREIDPLDRNREGDDGRELRAKPLSPASVRQRVAAAKAFYAALRWAGITEVDPFAFVELPKLASRASERARQKAYTLEELDLMARVASDWDDRLILLLGAHSGLRVSEMVAARWEDVDLRSGTLRVPRGKGGTDASVTLSAQLVSELRALRHERFGDGAAIGSLLVTRSRSRVFERVERMWFAGWALEGDAPPFEKGVHGLRHAAGVSFARATDDVRKVRDHLRHASLSSTEIYMGIAEGTDEVRSWRLEFG